MGFGNGVLNKDKNFNFNKPLIIPKGTDSWDNMNGPISTFEQVSLNTYITEIHLSPFPDDSSERFITFKQNL